jgi:hypothetical protein
MTCWLWGDESDKVMERFRAARIDIMRKIVAETRDFEEVTTGITAELARDRCGWRFVDKDGQVVSEE